MTSMLLGEFTIFNTLISFIRPSQRNKDVAVPKVLDLGHFMYHMGQIVINQQNCNKREIKSNSMF